MIRLILLCSILSLTSFDVSSEIQLKEGVTKYFYDGIFSKQYLELNFEQRKFTLSTYSCLNQLQEGNFEITGDKLTLKMKNHNRRLRLRTFKEVFYFEDNRKRLVYKFEREGEKYEKIFELKED